jgi:hypothetical protein
MVSRYVLVRLGAAHEPGWHLQAWRVMSSVQFGSGITILVGCLLFFSLSCAAQDSLASHDPVDFVTAQSRFGNGSIRGRVRSEPLGLEVELPSGHWVYCRRSCEETLRVETIDFFESNAAGSGQLTNECGIFGCLDIKSLH